MTDILTPPSPLASHSSTNILRDRTGQTSIASLYPGTQSSSSSSSLPTWAGSLNKSRGIHPYHTPPADGRASIMLHQGRSGLAVASQSSSAAPRENSSSYSHSATSQKYRAGPQLPVPQPHVTYQPVSVTPAAKSTISQSENGDAEEGPIASYMQIPSSINDSKGSLSEFASQITCLFWFESISNLQRVEEAASLPEPVKPLASDANPTLGFRKWVTLMLSTTQVTRNVILLALMFIYRLKTQNPQVRGKTGSEYRLLTVALMLGNKFLDDNTYTNKTWADVSGISVSEIHVMEVEFLSNMRYNLFTSEADWDLWHKKLGRFYDYFDKASKSPAPEAHHSAPSISPPSLGARQMPPITQHTSPPFSQRSYLPVNGNSYPVADPIRHAGEIESGSRSRKRSLDETANELYSKRLRTNASAPSDSGSYPPSLPNSAGPPYGIDGQVPRLPLPHFVQHATTQPASGSLYASAHLPPPQNRAMALVYNQPPQPQHITPLSIPQSLTSNARPHMPPITPLYDAAPHMPNGQSIPMSSGSPSNLALTPTSHELLSPSGFPIHRSSPYRPVRNVRTLLVPPPTSSLQNPTHDLGGSNLQFQPIGKPMSERKNGVVPYLPPAHDRSPWSHPYSSYPHIGS